MKINSDLAETYLNIINASLRHSYHCHKVRPPLIFRAKKSAAIVGGIIAMNEPARKRFLGAYLVKVYNRTETG